MKIKVRYFDKLLFKDFLYILSGASVLFSFISITIDVPDKAKIITGVVVLLCLWSIYTLMWVYANRRTSIRLNVENSEIIIKAGNIFDQEEFKVIGFNEYFDTIVDNKIISEKTLNGMYIQQYVSDIRELDKEIELDERMNNKIIATNENRKRGKKHKYKLGTIYQNGDFLLTAFSKFDEDNRAYLSMSDYINFLMNFWNEVDVVYSGKSVSIPLMGTGITRFKEYNNITDQELLELLLWSFKISRIKFTYPSVVTIVIHESKSDKINFYKLKEVI